VQVRRAGLPGRRAEPLEHHHVDPTEPQFTSQHQADRAGADHDDVRVHGAAQLRLSA
jgi:hypothetical protein